MEKLMLTRRVGLMIKMLKHLSMKMGRLKRLRPGYICVIYTSPSTRAVETAQLIAHELKTKEAIEDDRINELDHGTLSGTIASDPIHIEYQKIINSIPKDPILSRVMWIKLDSILSKKFKDESEVSALKRIRSFFKSLPKNKNTVIVTHSGIMYYIFLALFNTRAFLNGDRTNGTNCSIACISFSDNKYSLLTLPNTLHLGPLKITNHVV